MGGAGPNLQPGPATPRPVLPQIGAVQSTQAQRDDATDADSGSAECVCARHPRWRPRGSVFPTVQPVANPNGPLGPVGPAQTLAPEPRISVAGTSNRCPGTRIRTPIRTPATTEPSPRDRRRTRTLPERHNPSSTTGSNSPDSASTTAAGFEPDGLGGGTSGSGLGGGSHGSGLGGGGLSGPGGAKPGLGSAIPGGMAAAAQPGTPFGMRAPGQAGTPGMPGMSPGMGGKGGKSEEDRSVSPRIICAGITSRNGSTTGAKYCPPSVPSARTRRRKSDPRSGHPHHGRRISPIVAVRRENIVDPLAVDKCTV